MLIFLVAFSDFLKMCLLQRQRILEDNDDNKDNNDSENNDSGLESGSPNTIEIDIEVSWHA